MVAETRPSDRRKHVRFSADIGTRFQLTLAGDHLFYPARIRDVSRGGVKLVIDRRLEPGTVVKVMVLQPLKSRVAYCTPQENGAWAVGLSFHNEIGLPELLSVLERQTSPQWNNSSSMFVSVRN
ncbi:MAG TPA: PilZ domain-containing protein [Gemmataceae bacterium]|jgi:hypothetical protein|nr:PilZ domain-containing protein [Gemmataceae bacterium]